MTFHPDILSIRQKKVLTQIGHFCSTQGFYLAGGTALAIHLGHRRSRDFDWFTLQSIPDPFRLAEDIRKADIPFTTTHVERGTLYGDISGIRVSFIEYSYPLLESCAVRPLYNCRLAAPADIACMKLSAVTQRGSKKDFVDIYALASKIIPLDQMLKHYQKKFSVQDFGHVLFALTYFDDADRERMPFMLWTVNWKAIKETLTQLVRALAVP